jgi:hypothetical protein
MTAKVLSLFGGIRVLLNHAATKFSYATDTYALFEEFSLDVGREGVSLNF